MSKHSCTACSMIRAGVKSRKTLPHTCSKGNLKHIPIIWPDILEKEMRISNKVLEEYAAKESLREKRVFFDDIERRFGI